MHFFGCIFQIFVTFEGNLSLKREKKTLTTRIYMDYQTIKLIAVCLMFMYNIF